MKKIKVLKMSSNATLPTRAHPTDAGLDLYAAKDTPYNPGDVVTVSTDIGVQVEPGYVGLVRDRSSVSKKGLKVTAGIIDAGYTGEVCIVMLNHSGSYGCIQKGTKIAQLLVVPVALPEIEEVTSFDETERGNKGFGSSGQ